MKTTKTTLFALLATALGAGSLASCSSDPEYDDLETISVSDAKLPYDSEGVWLENNESGFINIDDYEFSHILDNGLVYGFTPSKVTDTSLHQPLYTYPYACAAGGGVKGPGSPYLVGYWSEYLETLNGAEPQFTDRSCRIYAEDGDTFKPVSVMVCNNTYMMYELLNGSDFMKAFGPDDWVTLTVHGVHLDGTESQVTDYLVNIEGTDVKAGILTSWKKFDLTSLGVCTGLYFTMDCTDSPDYKSSYGLNIPTYFCIDQLVVED